MRVLMVVRPATGGMKRQVLSLSGGLLAAGHEVAVAAPPDSEVFAGAVDAGLPVYPVPMVGPLDPAADVRAVRALVRVLRAECFDVVHAHGFKAGLVARVATILAHVPAVIVTVHNHVLYRDDISRFTKWRYRAAEWALAARTDRYIAVSDSLRDELIGAYHLPASKVITVHNGIEPGAFLAPQNRTHAREAYGLPVEGLVLGTACRFAPQKGLDTLIAALPEVRDRMPGTVLALGGDGPLAEELLAQAAESGVADAIVWTGVVDDMPKFFAALDVYVLPSRSEGLPLALVEAAAAAVPTIGTRAGGTPEVIIDRETGLLVDPEDWHGLAGACIRLLEDSERAKALGAAARKRAIGEFSPGAMIDRTLQVYAASLNRV
jgi:glycosyltransferase involved in cell wall biosynthesis